ncbi:MAG: hypothetical protein IJ880_02290 [Bacilli bacterium]|nr:hypothetical protein [Bacilli bacterium]
MKNKILTFLLPQEISGSFSFDEKEDEESKLINVEATDEGWVLYSTEFAKVIDSSKEVKSTKLLPNNFYIIHRNKNNYLIYTSEILDKSYKTYSYTKDINMLISNKPNANINYSCEYLGDTEIKVSMVSNTLVLETNKLGSIYINEVVLTSNKYYINSGDKLEIFGLKITFLNGLILINNPNDKVTIKEDSANIFNYKLLKEEEPKNIEFKDEDLYTEEEYFS